MLESYKSILHISGIRHSLIDDIFFYRKNININDVLIIGEKNIINLDEKIKKNEIIIFHFIEKIDIKIILNLINNYPLKKFGLYLHTFYPFSEDGTYLNKTYTKNKNNLEFINKINFIITQDNFSFNFINNFYEINKLNNAKIFLLNQAIDLNNIISNKIKSNRFRLGFIGSTSYIKGFEFFKSFLLKYGSFLNENGFDIFIFTLEKPGENFNLDQINKKQKIINNIHIIYNEFNKKNIYSKIDSLIIPSIWNETGPMILYEAFANKIPVIISDQESLQEKVINKIDSYIFKTGNQIDLLKAILWMKKNHKKVISHNEGFRYNLIENFNKQLIEFLDGL